jgi:squalene-hopene/tetraprenyl-beta-curcumene cyclase
MTRSSIVLGLVGVLLTAGSTRSAEVASIRAAIDRGSRYLIDRGQQADGSFSPQAGPAVTALAVTALAEAGAGVDAEPVRRAVAYLLSFRQDDGGIHRTDSPVANYETSIAIMALAACNADGQHDAAIAAARRFVTGLQWDDEEGHGISDPAYGGAGYGSHKRPDLSNTSFLIDALKSVGSGSDDPAIQRALVFVSRTQNLESSHNTLPFAAKNPDGGFYYTPANGGESQAGTLPGGGLRSYGSMTYAGLKSMIFAGLTRDDPRVQAAVGWLRKHYTFEENPGLGMQGLYYYFNTAAKALEALGEDRFRDAAGREHDWRSELAAAVIDKQQADGSWVNDTPRWMEGDPNLVTSYAVLSLCRCLSE